MTSISLLIPVYNEEASLSQLFKELKQFQKNRKSEIIFVNDGSTDNSLELLKKSGLDSTRIVDLGQNYGHQQALSTGLLYVSGQVVVTLDADLQHPLKLIPSMIEILIEQDFEVVQTFQKERTQGRLFKKIASFIFWKIVLVGSKTTPMKNSGDFRAMTSSFVKRVNLEPNPKVLRFLIPQLSTSIFYLEFVVDPRVAGKTKYTFRKMISLAMDSYFSLSVNPLKIIGRIAVLMSTLSLVSIFFAILSYVFYDVQPGWTSLISVNLLLGGLNLAAIAIIGQYIRRIYERVNLREVATVRNIIES